MKMSHAVLSNISNRRTGDRFIPRRSNSNMQIARFKLTDRDTSLLKSKDIFSQVPECFNSTLYTKLLKSTLNYNECRILSFNTKFRNENQKPKRSLSKSSALWPAFPRKMALMADRNPDIILDLPNFTIEMCSNIMDWGRSGYIATIFSSSVYLWHNNTDHIEEILNTRIPASRALRWNNAGTLLAVANLRTLSVWSMSKNTQIIKKCFEHFGTVVIGSISVLAWDKKDKYIVAGSTNGYICKFDISGKKKKSLLEYIPGHDDTVMCLQFCRSNRYLCSTGMDNNVRIWKWPSLQEHFEISYQTPVRAIAFHPWRDALLAVGGGVGEGSIALWNVCNYQQIGYMKPEKESFVDCLTWSPVTGELVSSHQIIDRDGGFKTKILVLAGLNKVVDTINEHTGRVLYMMWSPNGTKLGTAGTDENLFIWNFLGDSLQTFYKNALKFKPFKESNSLLSNTEKYIR